MDCFGLKIVQHSVVPPIDIKMILLTIMMRKILRKNRYGDSDNIRRSLEWFGKSTLICFVFIFKWSDRNFWKLYPIPQTILEYDEVGKSKIFNSKNVFLVKPPPPLSFPP